MEFKNKVPKWDNKGVEPSQATKEEGFKAGFKPPASYFNWFWALAMDAMNELQVSLSDFASASDGEKAKMAADIAKKLDKAEFTKEKIIGLLNGGTGGGLNADTLDGKHANQIYVTAGQKAGTILGIYATAEGVDTTASGKYSHAEGSSTSAIGNNSHSEGEGTTASGNSSHAEGEDTTASGWGSHAEGNKTTASGTYSHAEGRNTTASGYYSHAEGQGTTASGQSSHAEGHYTTASGWGSHAEGFRRTEGKSIAYGPGSHIEGIDTVAGTPETSAYMDFTAHAEGRETTASGDASHAEGDYTTASGAYSHSEGWNTTAGGLYSHAGGSGTNANGGASFAHGEKVTVIAGDKNGSIFGQFGETSADTLFAVANGTSETDKKLAFEVKRDGTVLANNKPVLVNQFIHSKDTIQLSLASDGWVGTTAPYKRNIAVANCYSGIRVDMKPIYSTIHTAAILEKEAWNLISDATVNSDNTITFICFEEKPTTALNVSVEVLK